MALAKKLHKNGYPALEEPARQRRKAMTALFDHLHERMGQGSSLIVSSPIDGLACYESGLKARAYCRQTVLAKRELIGLKW